MNMDLDSSVSSSNFLPNDFFTDSDDISEYIDLPCSSNFNRLYKIKRYGQWFVLKALRPEFVGQPLYISLMKKEYELASQLNHPYIVKTIRKELNSRVGPSIMMEYVDGITLSEFLKTKPDKEVRLRIIYQILDAMNYFHSKQIVHRDLKPSNILITHNGNNVKIIDFGLADADSFAVFKQPAGTVRYAAPEQLLSGNLVDCRADIYSFGKILQLVFPYNYRNISHKCILHDKNKRFQDVESIIKSFNNTRRVTRVGALLSILCIILLPTLFLITKNNRSFGYKYDQQCLIDQSFSRIDSIYTPIYSNISEKKYSYREFAMLDILSTYDAVDNIRTYYETNLDPQSLFCTQFVSSYQYKWGKVLQNLDSILKYIPSLYESYSDGLISLEEYSKYDLIYKEGLNNLNK